MLNINAKAMKVVREIIEDAEALGCKVIKMDCGATLIDMGINCEGSWKAGVLFTRASMGDMSTVTLGEFRLNEDYTFASVEVLVNKPLIACMASQIAGWKLGDGGIRNHWFRPCQVHRPCGLRLVFRDDRLQGRK